MSDSDQVQRIIFDNADVRGVVSGLDESFQAILAPHQYPKFVEVILGQMLAAVSILSTNLKFEGKLLLQAKGDGPVSMLMAECNDRNECRAIAQYDEDAPHDVSFLKLIGSGHLVITIDPDVGQRYQGFVPLEQETLAQCLEDYFQRSEQLNSKFILASDGVKSAGLMLQALPSAENNTDDWQRLNLLAETLSDEELLSLDNETLLYRLFHEEQCRLFPSEKIVFHCECSRERSEKALRLLAREELVDIISEKGVIEMDCQFCNSQYSFDASDIDMLFAEKSSILPASDELH